MDDDKIFDEEGERPRIKVTDRRKFTADGTLVDARRTGEDQADRAGPADDTAGSDDAGGSADELAREGSAAGPSAGAPPTADDNASPSADGAVAAETHAGDAQEPKAHEQPESHGQPAADQPPGSAPSDDGEPRIAAAAPSMADLPRDFSAFVESLYYEAMLFMGAIPDPRTGQTHEDVELAKYKIDILGMLQDKTDGNRTAEETQHLEEILYQLRMVYLQKSKAVKL